MMECNWPDPPFNLYQGFDDQLYNLNWSYDPAYSNYFYEPPSFPFPSAPPPSQHRFMSPPSIPRSEVPYPSQAWSVSPSETKGDRGSLSHQHGIISSSSEYTDPVDSIPGWSVSSNGSDGSHSRNLSSVNTPASVADAHEQKKRKRRDDSSGDESKPEEPKSKKTTRRSTTEAARERTKAVRGDKACLPCQLEKRGCTPINTLDRLSPCDRCFKRLTAPGRIVLCCRVNITDLGIFRGGPTQTFAHTLRYLILGSTPEQARSKQIKKLTDSDRRSAMPGIKVLNLSQGHSENILNLKVQRYNPKDGDKTSYTWKGDYGEEERYECPHYALADLEHVQITLERFLEHNIAIYIRSILVNATPLTKQVFETALAQAEESKLVELVLRFWVATRFIENAWHVLGDETLGMNPDWRPSSPYYGLVPVTPIMDQQIDNIVIFHLLEPLWTKIRKILRKKLLENKKPDWFELQLTLFILLNHVDMTMVHDIEFSNRQGLTSVFSNPPLIEKVTHAAETLLKYFHNPGINMYYPFYAPWSRVENDYGWKDDINTDSHVSRKIQTQKQYVMAIRRMLQTQMENQTSLRPGMELYWTGQLFRNDWTPGVVNAYA